MKNAGAKVEEWIARFKAVGITEDQMKRWHQVFERENPQGHQSFLEWLEMPAGTIRKVREESV